MEKNNSKPMENRNGMMSGFDSTAYWRSLTQNTEVVAEPENPIFQNQEHQQ